jgi:hypothetical protein
MSNTPERSLFGFKEVATRWGVSQFTVRRLVLSGAIRSINIGARRVISIEEIRRIEQAGVGQSRKSVAVSDAAETAAR